MQFSSAFYYAKHHYICFVHVYTHLWNDGDPGTQVVQSKVGNITVVNDNGPSGWLDDTEQSKSQ